MSMGLEWISDHAWELYNEMKYDIEEEAERGVWTTKDGREIPVEEMTTSHIQNTIALLERNNCDDMYTPWITVFHKELQRR